MKNETSFSLTTALRKKLSKLTFPELKELAMQAGNQAIYEALDEEKEDFERIAKRLGAEKAYQEYERLLEQYRDEKFRAESSELTGNFYLFLLAKTCFPAECEAARSLRLSQKPLY